MHIKVYHRQTSVSLILLYFCGRIKQQIARFIWLQSGGWRVRVGIRQTYVLVLALASYREQGKLSVQLFQALPISLKWNWESVLVLTEKLYCINYSFNSHYLLVNGNEWFGISLKCNLILFTIMSPNKKNHCLKALKSTAKTGIWKHQHLYSTLLKS